MEEFITAADNRWSSLLRCVDHDFYHYPCYVQAESNLHDGEAQAFYCEGSAGLFLIPLVRRMLPEPMGQGRCRYDAVTPYGYSGPIYTSNLEREDLQRALEAYVDQGYRQGFVTSFFRLHPLLNKNLISAIPHTDHIKLVRHGSTVSINLEHESSHLNKVLRTNHKRDIKKLGNAGFKVRINHWDDYAAFQDIYVHTMARLNAVDYYYFSKEYFTHLQECLAGDLHLCSVIAPDGTVAAGGIFAESGNIMQYHLGGTDARYLAHAPSKLMFFEMRNWAKEIGVKVLHLGGGLSAERDSLFEFKRGFATDEHDFYTLRITHDFDAYDSLNTRFLAKNCLKIFPNQNYFPLYRTRLDVSIA